ncbi:MAG: hypothetical protein WEB58_13680 [Planctomycetaceae bacterium]
MLGYLVAHNSKKVFCAGKIIRDEHGKVFELTYQGESIEALYRAMVSFILDHYDESVVFLTDQSLFDLDLSGYMCIEREYGLPQRGTGYFTLEDLQNSKLANPTDGK